MKTQLSLLLISIQQELLTLISICLAFFMPISGILIMIGVLISIDTFTGIWKANKLEEKITSRKLSSIISKLALYEITVIMFFLIDQFILNDIILTFFSVPFMLTKVVTKTLKPEKIKYIPWWVNFFAVLGVILFLILFVYFGYKMIKLYLL